MHQILFIITCLAFAGSLPLQAVEADGKPMAMPMHSDCPMCGKAVGDKPIRVPVTVGEGAMAKSFMIDCDVPACAEAFTKDPETVIKKHLGRETAGPKTNFK